MNYSELSRLADAGFPPGHPAGSGHFVSAGAVLSGRGQGRGGGSLASDLQVRAREPDSTVEGDGVSIEETSTGDVPTIMIAVEDSEESVDAVRTAHRLFGDGARYFVVNVGQGRYSSMRWAYVYPVMTPTAWYPPAWTTDEANSGESGSDLAEDRALLVADAAGVDDVTALGDVGDPATAIIQAAHEHAADVVVIASHERSWFSRLFAGSVERDVLRDADFAVLVVK